MYNLEPLFKPKSIAIIGASRNPNSVGQGILINLMQGGVFQNEFCRSFDGEIYPINPNADNIAGLKSYPSIKKVDKDIDLAIIAIPAKFVLNSVKECITKKVKAIIIISAGFKETGKAGEKIEEEIKKISKRKNIPIVGPNCLGIINTSSKMNASFAPSMPPEGNIAFLTQSGAIADSVIDWAISNRYGFSSIISYGNQSFLTVSDYLEWLKSDENTSAIAIYAESIPDGKRFMEIAKKVSEKKPIIIIKSGRTKSGSQAAMSHTGSLASSYEIYKAAFKQSNIFIADTVEELFNTAKALANQPKCKSNNIGIITNGGGLGVLCADYCEEQNIILPEIKKNVLKKLDKDMPKGYSRRNPLDILGDAIAKRYEKAIEELIKEKYIDGLIVIQTLQTMTNPEENAKILVDIKKSFPQKPIISVFMGGRFTARAVYILEKNNIPNYNDVSHAVKAMKALINK